ncbi:SagB family peptide dehydrogenase [Desulfogranum japonicum]|uniref:SagB family peptide dehydrogenase n=1 Tax=Desulfogranum japonicum TaxID=231447 RepID=UPI000420DA8E|nr:SagB family peptide dehydrogenase [Desulfogranum japonicum]
MDSTYVIGLRKDVRFTENMLMTNYGAFDASPFLKLSARMHESLLAADKTEDELAAYVLEDDDIQGLQIFHKYWQIMSRSALLTYTLVSADTKLATISPVGMGFSFGPKSKLDQGAKQLSRFALQRTCKGATLIECPKGWSQIDILDVRLAGVIFYLQAPHTVEALAEKCGLSHQVVEAFLTMLQEAQALTGPGEGGAGQEDQDPGLAHWEVHDLYFHTRCQLGRHNNGWATTYRFTDTFPPLPQVKEAMSRESVPLPKVERPASESFFHVHETRKTRRDFASEALTLNQLGTFLYHTVRVKEKYDDDKGGVTFRPAQGGGALHSIEVYPLVNRCEGLQSGFYHYNPLKHELERLSSLTTSCKQMLMLGRKMMLDQSEPQVELIFASRFRRIQWKYESLAYSVILKDVGCLYQTMAMVAEAMGLAGVALGGGHMDLFARISELDCYREGSVGAYMIGSRAPGTD